MRQSCQSFIINLLSKSSHQHIAVCVPKTYPVRSTSHHAGLTTAGKQRMDSGYRMNMRGAWQPAMALPQDQQSLRSNWQSSKPEDEPANPVSVAAARPVHVAGHQHFAPDSEQVRNASDCLLLMPDEGDAKEQIKVVSFCASVLVSFAASFGFGLQNACTNQQEV